MKGLPRYEGFVKVRRVCQDIKGDSQFKDSFNGKNTQIRLTRLKALEVDVRHELAIISFPSYSLFIAAFFDFSI